MSQFLLRLKSKYLKDYLCARGMFLYVTSYYSRDCILENVEHLKWDEKELKCKDDEFSEWEVRITPIHEGARPMEARWLFSICPELT